MNVQKPYNSTAFSDWYLKALEDAQFFDYSPVRGCMVFRPFGYKFWESIQSELNKHFSRLGVENAYFPLFIPEHFISKEKDHIAGFSPELAVVTFAGGSELEEPLVVRPTSETIIYHMFAKWIKTHKDLPLKINQWANVVRWEKRTKPFLRTTEFLWQEGHTAHSTKEEAKSFAEQMATVYASFMREYLAIPAYVGKKTNSEKFAGADFTITIEALMRDGKALQSCTSHLLAQSFPKAFEVEFADSAGNMQTPWCTSWGLTTRAIGATVMVHGSLEEGLILPPKIAPVQVSIVPIRKTSDPINKIDDYINQLSQDLAEAGIRFKVLDDATSPGNRFFQSEKIGVPFRIEFGLRDIEADQVCVAPRVAGFFDGQKKIFVPTKNLKIFLLEQLNSFHDFLLKRAEKFLYSNTYSIETFEELELRLSEESGFYEVNWCGEDSCEKKLKDIQATFRVIKEILPTDTSGSCFVCRKKANLLVYAAKSY